MATVETATGIRPSHVDIPEEPLEDLRRRIAATRWPTKELVEDRSQGVQLATLKELALLDDGVRLRPGRGEAERFPSSRPRSTGWRSTSSRCARGTQRAGVT
jgi:hypothetical protein